MSYNSDAHTTLGQLKTALTRTRTEYELADTKVETGEENVIESVSVNGTALAVTDKAVNITVPTAVSELTNDSDFKTGTEVSELIAAAVAESGHASFAVAETVPNAESAESNILYLVMNSETGYYDIYALVGDEVVLLDDVDVDLTGYATTDDVDELADKVSSITIADLIPDGAGPHNSLYRGEYLGDALTEDQLDAIEAGTFEDIFVGDYWTIDGVNYRVAGLDYFLGTGDTAFTAHHAVIVPDSCLATDAVYGEDYTAGYTGSTVYTDTLPSVLETVEAAFGADYVLTHRDYLVSACTSAMLMTRTYMDSQIELLTERMVYGAAAVGNATYAGTVCNNLTASTSQLPLFALNPAHIWIRVGYWLQDIAACRAVFVHAYGMSWYGNVTDLAGVRPYFCIGRAS